MCVCVCVCVCAHARTCACPCLWLITPISPPAVYPLTVFTLPIPTHGPFHFAFFPAIAASTSHPQLRERISYEPSSSAFLFLSPSRCHYFNDCLFSCSLPLSGCRHINGRLLSCSFILSSGCHHFNVHLSSCMSSSLPCSHQLNVNLSIIPFFPFPFVVVVFCFVLFFLPGWWRLPCAVARR